MNIVWQPKPLLLLNQLAETLPASATLVVNVEAPTARNPRWLTALESSFPAKYTYKLRDVSLTRPADQGTGLF